MISTKYQKYSASRSIHVKNPSPTYAKPDLSKKERGDFFLLIGQFSSQDQVKRGVNPFLFLHNETKTKTYQWINKSVINNYNNNCFLVRT